MDKNNKDDNINISSITQAAVGYVRDQTASKKMAEKFVAQVRVQLGQILATRDDSKESPLGKASPEAVALMEYVIDKRDKLKHESGYASAQASAIILKDELAPLQMFAGIANDSEMISSIRKVNTHVINELGEPETPLEDLKKMLRRKKRGRVAGSTNPKKPTQHE